MGSEHYRGLEKIYLAAQCNEIYCPEIRIEDSSCEVWIEIHQKLLHATDALHGSVLFKLLDDSAFFAANSVVEDVLVLTANFTVYFFRPVSEGWLRAEGKLVNSTRTTFVAESVVSDGQGRGIARGSGTFMHSNFSLPEK